MIVKYHPFVGTAKAIAEKRSQQPEAMEAPNYQDWVDTGRFYTDAMGECALVWTLMESGVRHSWDSDNKEVTVFIGGVSKVLRTRTASQAHHQKLAIPVGDRDEYLNSKCNALVLARVQEPNRHVDLLGAVPRHEFMKLEQRYPNDGKLPKVSQAMCVVHLLSLPLGMNFLQKLDSE